MTSFSSYRPSLLRDPRRRAFVEEVLSWKETPYHHHACIKGRGVDCIHLLIGAAWAVGLSPFPEVPSDNKNYPRLAKDDRLVKELDKYLMRIDRDALLGGDIAVFRITEHPQHVGIMVSPTHFVHAKQSRGSPARNKHKTPEGKVIETRLDGWWETHLIRSYRIPELHMVEWH